MRSRSTVVHAGKRTRATHHVSRLAALGPSHWQLSPLSHLRVQVMKEIIKSAPGRHIPILKQKEPLYHPSQL